MASSQYTYHICTAESTRGFDVGEEVFVHLKSDRDTGRAVVLQTPATVDPTYAGRYQVQYTCDASLSYHVRPTRLCRVARRAPGAPPQLLICASTTTYRRLARSQVTPRDKVLELGSSYGLCTHVLAHHAGPDHVLGIDNSHQLVAASQSASPGLNFLVLDVLEQPGELRRLAGEWGFNVLFVDIGGNRALEALLRLLPWLQQELLLELIVVKSEEMAEAAHQQLRDASAAAQQDPNSSKGGAGSTYSPSCCREVPQPQHSASPPPTAAAASSGGTEVCVGEGNADQQDPPACLGDDDVAHLTAGPHPPTGPAAALHQGTNNSSSSSSSSAGADVAATPSPSRPGGSQVKQEVAVTWLEVPGGRDWWQRLQHMLAAVAQDVGVEQQGPATPNIHHHHQQQQQGEHGTTASPPKQQQQQGQEEAAELLAPASSRCRVAEPWYIKEKEAGFRRNPLRYPQRFTPEGQRICRPHNYSSQGCLKCETCPFDHDHCHHCGAPGHRGAGCPVGV